MKALVSIIGYAIAGALIGVIMALLDIDSTRIQIAIIVGGAVCIVSLTTYITGVINKKSMKKTNSI